MNASKPPGQILTFYSYKGGTGRSMALANFAWVLAMAGKRVLAIDWDLEAPGLHRYFHPFLSDPELTSTEGVIDFVVRFIEAASAQPVGDVLPADWYLPYTRVAPYANSLDYVFHNGAMLDFIPAGKQGEPYATRVNSLNWKHFYEKLGGWSFMERMREHLRTEYDFILIDSRTGVSDTAGICTVQMPDAVVVCFTLNFQSIDGASAAARSIVEQRTKLGRQVRVFPVPMRVELSAEKIKYEQVSKYARQRFLPTRTEQEVLAGAELEAYWGDVEVPYVSFYAFEELLAWFLDQNRTTGVLASTMRLVRYVTAIDTLHLPGPSERERAEMLGRYAAVWDMRLRDRRALDYSRVCFVLVPFGTKSMIDERGISRTIDFDTVYENIFEPAIRATSLPEGGRLEPRRADKEFFASSIDVESFRFLEFSRFVIADITGLNPNVFFELGVRHRVRETGTAIFREVGTQVPFDIGTIRAFPYELNETEQSRQLVTRVLSEALQRNSIDSPVRIALNRQQADTPQLDAGLLAAENALRVGDRSRAIAEYRTALREDPHNYELRMRLGILLRDQGVWREALEQFDVAVTSEPAYADAWREKGIAEVKLSSRVGGDDGLLAGITSLRRAIELNPDDYEAHIALGSALKRARRFDEALVAYERATDLSSGHPGALLNVVRLRLQLSGRLHTDARLRAMLARAERQLRAQVASVPPLDAPWSFFDLAEIRLFQGDADGFIEYLDRGLEYASAVWEIETFVSSLRHLADHAPELPGLRQGIAILEEGKAMLA